MCHTKRLGWQVDVTYTKCLRVAGGCVLYYMSESSGWMCYTKCVEWQVDVSYIKCLEWQVDVSYTKCQSGGWMCHILNVRVAGGCVIY